jgi:hypothetical protein
MFWKWLTIFEQKAGGDTLAIARNGDLSSGIMFPFEAQWNGSKLDDESRITRR